MSSKGIMRRAWRHLAMLAFIVPAAFAQTPSAPKGDDLDVTMRVIVDPNAKVPDEIVRRIPLPKPAPPATSPDKATEPGKPEDKGKPDDKGKPADPGSQGQHRGSENRDQGREFGEQVSEEAKQRSEEVRRNENKKSPPGTPGTPGPPHPPPGRSNKPPPPPPGG